ncbi:hypothetical protein ACLEEB_14505 [Lonsdalea quercina]|uniref:hypothetical protein n=1 Tax=Lonsdalea quercina TaxID=71657 RepID=UPI0039747D2A
MSTEQMREEFEAWLITIGESADSQNGIYLSPIANIGWEAWQESRGALVVELPSRCECCYSEEEKGIFDSLAEDCAEAIRSAGITVRAER